MGAHTDEWLGRIAGELRELNSTLDTRLQALNALCDRVEAVEDELETTNLRLEDVSGVIRLVDASVDGVQSAIYETG